MIWGESLNLLHRRRYFILQDTNHFVIINSQSVNISSLIHKVASCRFSGKVYYMADSAAARCSEFCALIGPSCSLGISRVGPSRESSLFGRMMNRGYYMAARSANEWNIFQHEKRNFVSPSGHAMISLLCKHQWNAKPFHLNIFFAAKGAIYCEATATVIFSHVKITCEDFMFSRESPPGISLVFIYRGYYTVARRYEFYFRVAKQYFTNEPSEWVKYCFCHSKIKFVSSSCCVMFFLLYRQKHIVKIIDF